MWSSSSSDSGSVSENACIALEQDWRLERTQENRARNQSFTWREYWEQTTTDTFAGFLGTWTLYLFFLQSIVSWELYYYCTILSFFYLVHCYPLCGGGNVFHWLWCDCNRLCLVYVCLCPNTILGAGVWGPHNNHKRIHWACSGTSYKRHWTLSLKLLPQPTTIRIAQLSNPSEANH